MDALRRDVDAADQRTYDLVVVGGGIHGAMVLYEAARRGLSCLLLERGDFGEATSQNNFRILHGGLRYLQSMDLRRFRESVAERRWFMQRFPRLTQPLPCLMPLYDRGMKRRSVFRLALFANDALSLDRNRGVAPAQHLSRGETLSASETLAHFAYPRRPGLAGGALWQDACMPWPQRILMETLRQACADGYGQALNYCEAVELSQRAGRVCGVVAADGLSGKTTEFRTQTVVNAAGPWSPKVAERFGDPRPGLYPPTLAWNVLFDRPAPFEGAVAVTAPEPSAQTLFLLSWQGRLLAGTGHAAWHGDTDGPTVGTLANDEFIGSLNAAAPGLDLRPDQVERVYAGLLPGRCAQDHRLRDRPVIVDHGRAGGPQGLWSLSGVKFTTARRVAARLLRWLASGRRPAPLHGAIAQGARGVLPPGWWGRSAATLPMDSLRQLVAEEAVVHLDDLVLRRTNLGDRPAAALALAPDLYEALDWAESQKAAELARLRHAIGRAGSTENQSPSAVSQSAPSARRDCG